MPLFAISSPSSAPTTPFPSGERSFLFWPTSAISALSILSRENQLLHFSDVHIHPLYP